MRSEIERQAETIGIITPSYNQGGFIAQTIESVLGQHYAGLDYWIMDGGSTDNTVQILETYGDRIGWVSEQDGGQAEALNKGLRKVKGDIVAFINSDDLYLPGAFSLVVDYFRRHPDALWVTGDYFIVDEDGRRIQSPVREYKRLLRQRPSIRRLALANFVVQPSTFWRRGLLDEIGFFDERLKYCFDYDFWMRAILKHPLHVIDAPLSLFRIHSRSKGGSEFVKQFVEEHEVLKRYVENRGLLALHRLHADLIVFIYRFVKR
jgi:glycosyltransferase involved in cell wall biosynthesis